MHYNTYRNYNTYSSNCVVDPASVTAEEIKPDSTGDDTKISLLTVLLIVTIGLLVLVVIVLLVLFMRYCSGYRSNRNVTMYPPSGPMYGGYMVGPQQKPHMISPVLR